jgi:hypothetical protein
MVIDGASIVNLENWHKSGSTNTPIKHGPLVKSLVLRALRAPAIPEIVVRELFLQGECCSLSQEVI